MNSGFLDVAFLGKFSDIPVCHYSENIYLESDAHCPSSHTPLLLVRFRLGGVYHRRDNALVISNSILNFNDPPDYGFECAQDSRINVVQGPNTILDSLAIVRRDVRFDNLNVNLKQLSLAASDSALILSNTSFVTVRELFQFRDGLVQMVRK